MPPSFAYWARNTSGEMVAGTYQGTDERTVAAALGAQGLVPIRIEPDKEARLKQSVAQASPSSEPLPELGTNVAQHNISSFNWKIWKRVDHQEILIFLRELSSLLKAGIPLASCLEGSAKQAHSSALRNALEDVTRRVHGGNSLSDAFSRHPSIFPELSISMIRVGETAGILDQVLDQLAKLGTQELETRSRVRSALVYPMVLIGFAVLVVYGLLVGVLPRFVSVFESSQVDLPWPTMLLLSFSTFVRHYWWLVIIAGIMLFFMAKSYYTSPMGRFTVDKLLLRMPLVGGLYQKILVARIVRTLGSMLRTGVPMLEALGVTEKTVHNILFQQAVAQIRQAVSEGKNFSEPLQACGLFPHMVTQMVVAGERSGQLDNMLVDVADFYEPEIEVSIRNLTTLLEPVLLLVMGVIVGFIALSVLLPIFQLIHVFRR